MPKNTFSRLLTDIAALLGGRNETNVANASDATIKVTLSKGISTVGKLTVGANPMIAVEMKEKEEKQSIIIPPGESHRFDRESLRERMTIEQLNANSIPACENLPIFTNESYIVTGAGIERQKYGDPNLFVDEYGNDHRERMERM